MNRIDRFIKKCKHHNLKITPQRTVIYKSLMDSKEHPSADVIHRKVNKEFPSISLDTVCRTLATFTEIGIVHSIEGHGGPKRFDPNMGAHHHFCCLGCGELTDFYNETLDHLELPDEIKNKFSIITKRLVLSGYCEKCNKKRKEREGGS